MNLLKENNTPTSIKYLLSFLCHLRPTIIDLLKYWLVMIFNPSYFIDLEKIQELTVGLVLEVGQAVQIYPVQFQILATLVNRRNYHHQQAPQALGK